MKKKVLSMLVTFAMLLSMLPATALAADFSLTVDADSTLGDCTVIADSAATDAKVNGSVVTGTESAPQSVAVTGGVTTIKAAPINECGGNARWGMSGSLR